MPHISLPLKVLALLFSLATYTLATSARIRLSKGSCSRSTPWTTTPVDKCIPITGTVYQSGSLEVSNPWPVCNDGQEAKLAFYWPQGTNCEEAALNTLSTKTEAMSMCNLLMMTGSLGFVCEGIKADTPPPEDDGDKTDEGGVIKYTTKTCSKFNKPAPTFHAPDTCISVNEGLGLEFSRGATCKNGTKAMVAGFKGEDCDPTSSPLEEPFTKWDDRAIGWCVPTQGIRSMSFWCDGLEGVDMTKPGGWKQGKKNGGGGNSGLILGLSLGLGGGLLFLVGALVVAYNINRHFRAWVQKRFGGGDGYIAL